MTGLQISIEATPAERWFAFRLRARLEAAAEINLALQGFRTFFPRLLVTSRRARKFETSTVLLFPRYAFISLDLKKHRWRSVNGTIGVEIAGHGE